MAESSPEYKRAALVMFPKKKQLSLMLSSKGAKWALEELEKSKGEGPTNENREIIGFLLREESNVIIAAIMKIIFGWNDAAVWGDIIEQDPGFFMGQDGYTDLCNGWQVFGFDGVRPT